MERDRYGNYADYGESKPLKSSALRARSTINYRLSDSPEDVETVAFNHDYEPSTRRATRPVPRKRDERMIDEYHRRKGNLPDTDEDYAVQTTKAYRLPRYKMELPPQPTPRLQRVQKPITRRKMLWAIGIAVIGASVGGAYVKQDLDYVSEREVIGKYGFTSAVTSNNFEVYAWIEADYCLRLLQVSATDPSKVKITKTAPVTVIYSGPLDQIQLDIQEQALNGKPVIGIKLTPQNGANGGVWTFTYNGQYYV